MTSAPDGRQIIPAGKQPAPWFEHLLPVAKFLIEERGHLPIYEPDDYGFHMGDDGFECRLTRSITAEDWAAINDRFVIPKNIWFFCDYIVRDDDNGIDMIGFDTLTGDKGIEPIDRLEAEIRERDGGRWPERA
ncbi:MAG TPA: hypothetical protein VHV82_22735 [Sporichthyaceae bacterium]|jgi:hypothetical protein|nr:hypothetical protein [Sporichthyaceae bacterium]